jgi:two-component system NtrC family sensor kinase
MFLNLIDNALEAMRGGGRLRIAAEAYDHSVVVQVQDTVRHRAGDSRLFQPFVTARKKKGRGPRLVFSHQTVLDNGGELWADAESKKEHSSL